MEAKFFSLFSDRRRLSVSVGFQKNCDWIMTIEDNGENIFYKSGCDRVFVFAKAYVFLCEYLSEKYGGY